MSDSKKTRDAGATGNGLGSAVAPKEKERRRGRLRGAARHIGRRAKVVCAIVALVAALVVGFGIGNGGLVTQGPTHVDSTTIKNSFSDIAELATQEYDFSNVGKFSQDDMKILDLSIPFTGKSFLVTYSGSVKAGISDISKAQVSVDDASKTVNVTLPQVSVLDAHIDSSSVKTYDQTLNPINQLSVDDVTGFISSEEDARKQEAIDGGILDRARDRAQGLVESNVRAALSNSAESDYAVNVTWQDS